MMGEQHPLFPFMSPEFVARKVGDDTRKILLIYAMTTLGATRLNGICKSEKEFDEIGECMAKDTVIMKRQTKQRIISV
jgi:hypothetical protein